MTRSVLSLEIQSAGFRTARALGCELHEAGTAHVRLAAESPVPIPTLTQSQVLQDRLWCMECPPNARQFRIQALHQLSL